MKRTILLLVSLFFISSWAVMAENNRGGGEEKSFGVTSAPRPAAKTRQPVVINMNHGTSGGHNHNYPPQQTSRPAPQQQQPQQQSEQHNQQQPVQNVGFPAQANPQPSYGQLHWNTEVQSKPQPQIQNWTPATHQVSYTRPSVSSYTNSNIHAAVAVHHHPYQQGYVRKKLQKIGVTAEPNLITDRAEIIHTDRAHSVIQYPRVGPDNGPLNITALSPRHFNDPVVRDQMRLLDGQEWQSRIEGYNAMEFGRNQYYWHQDGGINYCHYIDGSGYHWWGWYSGDQFFWTRNYASRWWWYDSDFDRWCFWNNGFWWWQDPYHVGDLYCYNNDSYVPCNSAEDQVVVTAPIDTNEHDLTSPDGTRLVKLFSDSQDAFLYDTATPPTFDPVYLASGVKTVQFSDTSNGRPLQVILSLNDGSYDMFDNYGNTYNPGTYDADQSMTQNNLPPADQENANPPTDQAPSGN